MSGHCSEHGRRRTQEEASECNPNIAGATTRFRTKWVGRVGRKRPKDRFGNETNSRVSKGLIAVYACSQ